LRATFTEHDSSRREPSNIRARGFDPADDNEADALAILLWAIETNGGVR
jgi:hypothetical protein